MHATYIHTASEDRCPVFLLPELCKVQIEALKQGADISTAKSLSEFSEFCGGCSSIILSGLLGL